MSRTTSQRSRTATTSTRSKPTVLYDGLFASHTTEYSSWANMLSRCKPNYYDRQYYLDAGITVCEEWSGECGFANFYEDMGRKPSKSHSIDRIDSTKGYEPENCRWATNRQQVINRNLRPSKTSIFRGVYKQKNSDVWYATIDHKTLGRFASEYQAAMAYDEEAIKRHGDEAHLNFTGGISHAV